MKQTLGDIVVSADHTNNHDNCTVAIKASKTFSNPIEDQSDFIVCDPAMEAGVAYSLGMRYLYADITSRSTSADPTNGKQEPVPSIFDVLMKAGRQYEHLLPSRYTYSVSFFFFFFLLLPNIFSKKSEIQKIKKTGLSTC